jgi:hypothetical protein
MASDELSPSFHIISTTLGIFPDHRMLGWYIHTCRTAVELQAVTPDLSPVLVTEYRKALAGLGPVPIRDWTGLSSYRFIVGREDRPGTALRHPQWRNDHGITVACI